MSCKLLSLNILPLTRSAIHFEASKRTKTRSERKREGKRVGGKVKVGIYSIYIKRETERNKEKEREDIKNRKQIYIEEKRDRETKVNLYRERWIKGVSALIFSRNK